MSYVWVQISFQGIKMGEVKEKRLQGFLYWGWVALSNKGGCVVETSLEFSSKYHAYNFVGNEGIYSMGEGYNSHI